jgi:hypothetical protein
MKSISPIIALIILSISLACGLVSPKPTATPIPTATDLPTVVPSPRPTATLRPTETAIPATVTVEDTTIRLPTGEPVDEWQGIPVMPGALTGEGDSQGYAFTIEATSDDVAAYYQKQMVGLGWETLGSGQGDTGAVIMIFTKQEDVATVSILPQQDGLLYVLMVK